MSLKVEQLENNMAKLTIEVPAEEFSKAVENAYQRNKKKISVPGFRAGKVPKAMIEKMYGKEVFYEEAMNAIIPEAYAKAYDECEEELVSAPKIDVVQAEEGKDFIFTAEVALKPDVELGKYKGIEIDKINVDVTDEEVDAAIEVERKNSARTISVDNRPVQDGDTVTIDFEGFKDGVAFEGGKGTDYPLTIGSHSFVDTFEEQLIGTHPGDEVTVNVTFPEDYSSEDLAGKDASFAVTVHGIYVTPEFTDDFVMTYLSDQASTADEYRTIVENRFYESHLKEYIQNYIMDNSTMNSYPKKFLKTVKGILKYNDEYSLDYYNQMFAQYGMVGYENVWDTRDGIDSEEAYEAELTERAKDAMKESFVYQGIYEKAGLSLDVDAYLAEITETYGEEYVTNMKEMYGTGYMAQAKISEMVIDYLMENVNVQ